MSDNWTRNTRERLQGTLPIEHLLPDTMPVYVNSGVYWFGVLTIVSFLWIIVSGAILVLFGPDWWHISNIGHFFNSMHFWGVQAFFFFMVLHLWAQFFMASWRNGRQALWVGGWVLFLLSIVTAFTGYLSQTNFDSQWIGVQGKDAMNSAGIGGFFNLLNFGQMFGLHVFLLPVAILVFIGLHVLLVRKMGVVEPFSDREEELK